MESRDALSLQFNTRLYSVLQSRAPHKITARAFGTKGDASMPQRKFVTLGLCVALAAWYGSGAGAADTAGGAAAGEPETLDTIIVTARKRDESLAQVPISITAFTAQSLE